MSHEFRSFDQVISVEGNKVAPDRYRQLMSLKETPLIPRGSGLSYTAMSFSSENLAIEMKHFNRILEFDPDRLTIKVEAGIQLAKLYDFLDQKNLFLSVQPGHPQISVGGCIACNIFGKNQVKEGLFQNIVLEMELFHPSYGLIRINREERPEIFDLTCGGFGLTGIIVTAKLKVAKKPGQSVQVKHIKVKDLKDTYETLVKIQDEYDLLYTWNDFAASKEGRGFVVAGKFSDQSIKDEFKYKPISSRRRNFLFDVMKKLPLFLLNSLYYFLNTSVFPSQILSLFQFNFPVSNKTFYFKLFGQNGFVEKQMLVTHQSAPAFIEELLVLIKELSPSIALCSCKLFRGRQKYLNFDGSGVVISLDLSNSPTSLAFIEKLDDLCVRHHVILNICKDSSISEGKVKALYPEYEKFKAQLLKWDPKRLFRSEISKRIGL